MSGEQASAGGLHPRLEAMQRRYLELRGEVERGERDFRDAVSELERDVVYDADRCVWMVDPDSPAGQARFLRFSRDGSPMPADPASYQPPSRARLLAVAAGVLAVAAVAVAAPLLIGDDDPPEQVEEPPAQTEDDPDDVAADADRDPTGDADDGTPVGDAGGDAPGGTPGADAPTDDPGDDTPSAGLDLDAGADDDGDAGEGDAPGLLLGPDEETATAEAPDDGADVEGGDVVADDAADDDGERIVPDDPDAWFAGLFGDWDRHDAVVAERDGRDEVADDGDEVVDDGSDLDPGDLAEEDPGEPSDEDVAAAPQPRPDDSGGRTAEEPRSPQPVSSRPAATAPSPPADDVGDADDEAEDTAPSRPEVRVADAGDADAAAPTTTRMDGVFAALLSGASDADDAVAADVSPLRLARWSAYGAAGFDVVAVDDAGDYGAVHVATVEARDDDGRALAREGAVWQRDPELGWVLRDLPDL